MPQLNVRKPCRSQRFFFLFRRLNFPENSSDDSWFADIYQLLVLTNS